VHIFRLEFDFTNVLHVLFLSISALTLTLVLTLDLTLTSLCTM